MTRRFIAAAVLVGSLAGPAWATTPPDLQETREIKFSTSDAPEVKQAAQDLGSPVRIYEYLLNEFEYLPYYGVRSDSRNTFWRKGGNDIDLAALLIAMLRSQGIRARYATASTMIPVPDEALESWLAVSNRLEATQILYNNRIPFDATQNGYVLVAHVWAEALLPVANYRGIAGAATSLCTTESTNCKWIALDPSFKAHLRTASTLDPTQALSAATNFDYTHYYNAIKNPGDAWQNKNPADLLREQILSAHPSLALTDILGSASIVPAAAGILPGSLPFEFDPATLQRYVSAANHDGLSDFQDAINCAATPPTGPLVPWTQCLILDLSVYSGSVQLSDWKFPIPLDRLSSENSNAYVSVFVEPAFYPQFCGAGATRCDLISVKYPGSDTPFTFYHLPSDGEAYVLDVSAPVGPPIPGALPPDYSTVIERNTTYLLVAGGIETNAMQVAQATNTFLTSFGGGRVEKDSGGYYVDSNGNGIFDTGETRLTDVDTRDLLAVAARLYAYKDQLLGDQLAGLTATHFDARYDFGFVSSQTLGTYVDGAPFAVTPAGLLLDVVTAASTPYRVITSGTCADGTLSPAVCNLHDVAKLSYHVGSSLEHEVWQQLTNFDAISTVRGIQKALARGATWLDLHSCNPSPCTTLSADLTNLYNMTGFDGSAQFAPVGLDLTPFVAVTGDRPVAWKQNVGNTVPVFEMFKKVVDPALAADPDPKKAVHMYPVTYYAGDFDLYVDPSSALKFNKNNRGYCWAGAQAGQSCTTGCSGAPCVKGYTFSDDNVCIAGSRAGYSCSTDDTDGTTGCPGATCPHCCGQEFSGVKWDSTLSCMVEFLTRYSQSPPDGVPSAIPFPVCLADQFTGTVTDLRASIADQWAFFKTQYNQFLWSHGLDCVTAGCIDLASYLDQNTGFVVSDFALRTGNDDPLALTVEQVTNIRNDFFGILPPGDTFGPFVGAEYVLPSKRIVESEATGDTASFQVFYATKKYSNVETANMSIALEHFAAANGGYVVGTDDVTDSTVNSPETVTYDNESHTDQVLNPDANNSPHSSSTGDPVSTATGNMFHEETDFTIPAEPFDFVFSRAYNSRPGRLVQRFTDKDADRIFWPLGPGWTHSYAMVLIANDFGEFPNDSSVLNDVGQPANTDGWVSSVTLVDEHGAEYNFPIVGNNGTCRQSPTCSVKSPTGFFGTLTNPTSPTPSIVFPDGTRYGFQQLISMTDTNGVAVLQSIEAADGRKLTIDFGGLGGFRTQTITDALGRQLTLHHNTGRLTSVSDWTGHTWMTFGYDGTPAYPERLMSATNYVGKVTAYQYHIPSDLIQNGIPTNIGFDIASQYRLDKVLYPPFTLYTGPTLQRTMAFDYYTDGWAASTTDTLGNTEQYAYDLFRRSATVTDPRGFTRTHVNDARGALQTLVEADGNVLNFKSTSDNLRCEKDDAYGHATLYSYRADESLGMGPAGCASAAPATEVGNVTLEQDPTTHTRHYGYTLEMNNSGRNVDSLTATTDKDGRQRNFVYCSPSDGSTCVQGKLKTISVPATSSVPNGGPIEQRTTYANGVLHTMTELFGDPVNASRSRVTTYLYNTNGSNATTEVRPHGKTVTGTTSGGSLQWNYTYDSLGHLTVDSLQFTPTIAPGCPGPTHIAGTVHIQTQYGYDALGRVTSVTRPDGSTIYTDYDEDGNPWQVRATYSNAVTRTLAKRTFDAAGRRTSETDTLGGTTQWTYDEMGNVLTVTDANGHVTSYEYDMMGRPIRTTDPNGNETLTDFDATGRVDSLTTPAGTTTFTRDAVGRVTQTQSPLGYKTVMSYDGEGHVTTAKDANVVTGIRTGNSGGNTVTNSYDSLGRLMQTQNAEDGRTINGTTVDGTTKFEYDLLGERTAVVDAKTQRTEFTYNDLGQLTQIKDPLGNLTKLAYDSVGQLAARTDRNNRLTCYSYDGANRLTGVDFLSTGTGVDEGRSYDAFGNLQSISNANVTYTFGYDNLNRRMSQTDSRTGKSIHWSYDAVGNILSKIGYEGDVTTYTYDSANRLVGMTNPDYLGATYHYDTASRLLDRILSNGTRTTFTYDDDSRLIGMSQYSATASLVSTEQYCLDQVGNIVSTLSDPNGTCPYPGTGWTKYLYDDLYRLSDESTPSGHLTGYSYDAVGNLLTAFGDNDPAAPGRTYRYDGSNGLANRVTSITTPGGMGGGPQQVYAFDYDAEGNRTAKRDANNTIIERYDYDDKNRMIALHQAAQTTIYAYDPFDYRIGVQAPSGQTTIYALNGEHIEAIYDGALEPQATFLHGAVIDEIVGAYYYAPNGQKTFYTYDHDRRTSVTGLADHTGALQQTYTYGPFGADRIDTTLGTTPAPNVLKYTGREQDPVSGLYYYRARFYDPLTRRFMSEDPLGFQAGVNFYTYVNNNPLSNNDPDGQFAIPLGFALGGAAVGLATQGFYDYAAGQRSSLGTYLGAATSGAIAGFALVSGGGLWATVAAGSRAGFAGNFVQQTTDILTGAQQGYNLTSSIAATATGGIVAGAFEPLAGALYPTEYGPISQGLLTKYGNGTIAQAAPETVARMVGTEVIEENVIPASAAIYPINDFLTRNLPNVVIGGPNTTLDEGPTISGRPEDALDEQPYRKP